MITSRQLFVHFAPWLHFLRIAYMGREVSADFLPSVC